MNPLQQAVSRFAGIEEALEAKDTQLAEAQSTWESERDEFRHSFAELTDAFESLDSQNALMQRQLEDVDYLNLFDIGGVTEIIPSVNRKNTIFRLRRLRQENPLAKQAIKLITRFTLGKGVELIVGPDPETKAPLPPLVNGGSPSDSTDPAHKANGLYPGNKPSPTLPPGNRPRPQVGKQGTEAVSNLPPSSGSPLSKIDSVSSVEDNSLKDIIQAAWKDPDNRLALTSRPAMTEWVDNVATDGERFFVGVEDPSPPYVKITSIPLEEIDTIIYDPDNWRRPVYYVRTYQPLRWNGVNRIYEPVDNKGPRVEYYLDYRIDVNELPDLKKKIKVPAKELTDPNHRMFHTYINPLWTKKGCRGVSELYSSREWFRVYKEFMEDRAAINAAATSVAYKRKIKGGPTEVARFGNRFGGKAVGYESEELGTEISKTGRPGTAGTYDSNPAVDLEWMKTDTGAVNAKEDGRSILTAGGAGVGMFVHYFGDGGDANLATAQAMELPMVKTFEDWQQWVEDDLREFCWWVIRVATDPENATKQIDRIAGAFPPIISQDVVKYMTAWSQLAQNVAPGNRVVASEAIKGALQVMNVPNVDSLMREIDSEQQQLELQRQAQHQAMLDAMSQGSLADQNTVGDGKGTVGDSKLAARDGSANAGSSLDQAIVKGKTVPKPNGPKPPR